MRTLPYLLHVALSLQLISCQGQEQQPVSNAAPITSFSPIQAAKALSHQPLFISNDYGESWEDASYNLPTDLQVSFLARKGEEIVLASDNMGVYLSTKQRTHWKAIGAELPGQKINALHIADDQIYVGVFRQGLYRSKDEGQHWENLNLDLPNLTVQSILQVDDQILTGTDDGLFLLPKGSSNWQATNLKAQVLSIYQYEGVLIAGTSEGTAISHDLGNHWQWIRKEGAVHYTHNIGPRIIELVISGDVVYSDNWGEEWHHTLYGPRQGSYVYEIIDLGPYQLLSNNYGIHRSADQGRSWQLIYPIETMAFFDFLLIDDTLYGGTRIWDEFRGRGN